MSASSRWRCRPDTVIVGAARWSFLALRADRRDYVPIRIEDGDLGIIELEASRHRRQGRKEQAREVIKPERRQSVAVRSQEAVPSRVRVPVKVPKGQQPRRCTVAPSRGTRSKT